MNHPVDIVIPVWNRPCETRSCLASLVECSPAARIIMVNYGSERETECVLEEFAEALDERAILVSTERNIGRIAAINLGLGLSSAPFSVIVQDDIRIEKGWLDSLTDIMSSSLDIGLVIPLRPDGKIHTFAKRLPFQEMDHGSLGILLVRREMFQEIGGFDTEMDGGLWCLRDYSRRAISYGYRTVSTTSPCANYGEPQLLGSVARREERVRQGELSYLKRWGNPRHFCFAATGIDAWDNFSCLVPEILTAARQGHTVSILADRNFSKMLANLVELPVHENIGIETLPLIFTRKSLRKKLEKLQRAGQDTLIFGSAKDESCHASMLPVGDFSSIVSGYQEKYYYSGKVT